MDTIGFAEFFGILFGLLISGAVLIIPMWKICSRAGYSPWLSIMFLVPILNILLLYYLAFAEWPALNERR